MLEQDKRSGYSVGHRTMTVFMIHEGEITNHENTQRSLDPHSSIASEDATTLLQTHLLEGEQ